MIQIRSAGQDDRGLLITMYDRFDPPGEALGLPPRAAEARRAWIGEALNHGVNVAAISPSGEIVGHCFLVPDSADSAELAIFVHQDFRRRGIGSALVRAVLASSAATGFRRVWTLTASDNRAAIALQLKCGFRPDEPAFGFPNARELPL